MKDGKNAPRALLLASCETFPFVRVHLGWLNFIGSYV
jgi:hypothetical protein